MAKEYSAKIIVVGDGAVGKTTLILRLKLGRLPENTELPGYLTYHPFSLSSGEDGAKSLYNINMGSVNTREDADRLRALSYPQTDLFLVCYSVDRHSSLRARIADYWLPEVQHHCPGVPYIFVGLKTDLRAPKTEEQLKKEEDERKKYKMKEPLPPLTKEEAATVLEKLGGRAHLEVSAYTGEGMEELKAAIMQVVSEIAAEPKSKAGKAADGKKHRPGGCLLQ